MTLEEYWWCTSRIFDWSAEAAEAEALAGRISLGDDAYGALRGHLRQAHDISVRLLPPDAMPLWRRRFDRHSRRLFLSERLSAADRLREVAVEVAGLALSDAIHAEVASLPLASDEARRLAMLEVTRYAGRALTMPYGAFQAAAERVGYDVDLLASRFQTGFADVAGRLTSLVRQAAPGVPFFMMEVDAAGNRLQRAGAQGFPLRRFGGGCVKLAVHAAFAEPGRLIVEDVVLPDGTAYVTIARTLDGLQTGPRERVRRTAILLACDVAFRHKLNYAGPGPASDPVAIGPACRLCERPACLSRAEPPLTRPLGLDAWVGGLSAFDFQ